MSTDPSLPEIQVTTRPKERGKTRTRQVPPYHVILENDDFHSFEFVVDVLQKAMGYSKERAFQLTSQAHTSGRAIVWTGPKEVAELKVEQITTYHEIRGSDQRKLGPLGCHLEPAPGG